MPMQQVILTILNNNININNNINKNNNNNINNNINIIISVYLVILTCIHLEFSQFVKSIIFNKGFYVCLVGHTFGITCCALIFIFRLHFPPGISIAIILKSYLYIIRLYIFTSCNKIALNLL